MFNRKPLTPIVLALALTGLAPRASAEEMPAPILLAQAGPMEMNIVRNGTRSMMHNEGGENRVVKGAPYCADASHETVQVLPDSSGGAPNRIVNNTATRLCRDGEGRTRQEVTSGGRKMIYLRDPVAKENWLLDPERKLARPLVMMTEVMKFTDGNESGHGKEWARELGEKIKEQVAAGMAGAGAAGGKGKRIETIEVEPVVITRKETMSGDDKEKHVEVRVIRTSGEGKGAPPSLEMLEGLHGLKSEGMMPLGVRMQALGFAPRGNGVTTALGSKEIDGVKVNGERTTWTVEAGKIGNEKPIVSTREVWTSPDLLLTVYSRETDPRNGDVTYKLSGMKRGEPDSNLFKVPADYEKKRIEKDVKVKGQG